MAVTEVFAGVVVADIDRARAWYELVFGREPDLVPNDREAAWQLAPHAWLYATADTDQAPGHALNTILVDDLDASVADVASRGIDVPTPVTMPGAARTVTLTDPDGNRIQFAQPLSVEQPDT